MEEVFTEVVKILSEDADLLQNKVRFLDSLGICRGIVGPWIRMFDMGHCRPYDLIKVMLSEWISIQNNSPTIGELRRILQEGHLFQQSDKLKKLQEKHTGPIKILLKSPTRNDTLKRQSHSSDNFPQMEITIRPIAFGLKSVVQNFTGREEELGRLHEYFHTGCPLALISGLGGIGKTELAKKFALDILDPSGNAQIVKSWLSGENPQSLLHSLSQFCHQLHLSSTGPDGKPLGVEEMIQNIMGKFKSSTEFGRWVVIIDNVDEVHEEFKSAVQTLREGSDAFILVTSRRRDIFPGELELLEVTKMQLEDSMEFVRRSLKITDSSNSIKSLCLQLDNFPLALSQSVAFIKEQQTLTLKCLKWEYGIQNYLDELAKNGKLGLDQDRELGYSTATLAVWNITIYN